MNQSIQLRISRDPLTFGLGGAHVWMLQVIALGADLGVVAIIGLRLARIIATEKQGPDSGVGIGFNAVADKASPLPTPHGPVNLKPETLNLPEP